MWVIISLLIVISVVILVLCIPLELAFQAHIPGKPRARFKMLWLYGLVAREMVSKEKTEEKIAAEKPKPKKKKRRSKDILVILRTKGFLKQMPKL